MISYVVKPHAFPLYNVFSPPYYSLIDLTQSNLNAILYHHAGTIVHRVSVGGVARYGTAHFDTVLTGFMWAHVLIFLNFLHVLYVCDL